MTRTRDGSAGWTGCGFHGPCAGTRGPRAWELIREVGLSPPLILRESGRQTGRATELCESAEDLSDALARAAPDRDHYVVEYLDTRDGEGRFRKMRAFAIG